MLTQPERGTRFGRLVALYPGEKTKHDGQHTVCRCDCGTYFTARTSQLLLNRVQSCGCGSATYQTPRPGLPTEAEVVAWERRRYAASQWRQAAKQRAQRIQR